MIALLCFFLALFASPFKSKGRLEAENAAVRHQLIILRRKVRGRATELVTKCIGMYRIGEAVAHVELTIVVPPLAATDLNSALTVERQHSIRL
jgi:hypothetical protein